MKVGCEAVGEEERKGSGGETRERRREEERGGEGEHPKPVYSRRRAASSTWQSLWKNVLREGSGAGARR